MVCNFILFEVWVFKLDMVLMRLDIIRGRISIFSMFRSRFLGNWRKNIVFLLFVEIWFWSFRFIVILMIIVIIMKMISKLFMMIFFNVFIYFGEVWLVLLFVILICVENNFFFFYFVVCFIFLFEIKIFCKISLECNGWLYSFFYLMKF